VCSSNFYIYFNNGVKMPTMIDRIANALLVAWQNQPYEFEGEKDDFDCKLWYGEDDLIMEGTREECQKEMRERVAKIYAKAVLEEMLKPDAAMLWAQSKGYVAMIQAALDSE
jgi:hypothetical protein